MRYGLALWCMVLYGALLAWHKASATSSSAGTTPAPPAIASPSSSSAGTRSTPSRNKNLDPGIVLGKDRELFHIVLDLKWFFSKIKDYSTWLDAAKCAARFTTTTVQRFNVIKHYRHYRREAQMRDLAVSIDLYARLYDENPDASIKFFGGTMWQALDYARRKSHFLILYVERENEERVRWDNGAAFVSMSVNGDADKEDGDASSSSSSDPERERERVSTNALCRRALGDVALGDAINSQFVFFGGQTASPSTKRLLRRLHAKDYPYFAVLHVPPPHHAKYESLCVPLDALDEDGSDAATGAGAGVGAGAASISGDASSEKNDGVVTGAADAGIVTGAGAATGTGTTGAASSDTDGGGGGTGTTSGANSAAVDKDKTSWTFSRRHSPLGAAAVDVAAADSQPEVLGTLKIGRDIKKEKIVKFLLRVRELHGDKLVKDTATNTQRRR